MAVFFFKNLQNLLESILYELRNITDLLLDFNHLFMLAQQD